LGVEPGAAGVSEESVTRSLGAEETSVLRVGVGLGREVVLTLLFEAVLREEEVGRDEGLLETDVLAISSSYGHISGQV